MKSYWMILCNGVEIKKLQTQGFSRTLRAEVGWYIAAEFKCSTVVADSIVRVLQKARSSKFMRSYYFTNRGWHLWERFDAHLDEWVHGVLHHASDATRNTVLLLLRTDTPDPET